MLTQGCFYAFDPWTGSTRAPHYSQEREVHVGSKLRVQAEVTPAGVSVRSIAVPQCRHAKFGTLIERQSRSGTPSFWAHASWLLLLAGAETGFGALAAKGGQNDLQDGPTFAAGMIGLGVTSGLAILYLASLAGDGRTFPPWFMPHSDDQQREVVVGDASAWDGQTDACGAGAGYPSLPVGLLATFENSRRKILWRGKTGEDDVATFDAARTVQAVAHYCGAAHVVVGQLVTSEAKPNLDEGRPDAPRAVIREAADVIVDLGEPIDVPLASIGDTFARRVATECNDARLAACVVPGDAVRADFEACEDECAASVGVAASVVARRACDALAQDDDEHGICGAEYAKALARQGVEMPDLASCMDRCATRKRAERCK